MEQASPTARSEERLIEVQEIDVFALMGRVFRTAWPVTMLCVLAACTSEPRKSEAQQQADKALASAVEQALSSDEQLYARHITVKADDGVVQLSGYVWEPPDIPNAERIAGSVQGVVRVVNSLELQRNGVGNSPVSR